MKIQGIGARSQVFISKEKKVENIVGYWLLVIGYWLLVIGY